MLQSMKYVALLRGINVGGAKIVRMAYLKKVFEDLGFTAVTTYINSGNVIFTATRRPAVATIEAMLKRAFGFEVRCVIRDAKNIIRVAAAIPASWHNDTQQKTDILFLWDSFDRKQSLSLIPARQGVDTIRYVTGAILWHIERKNYSKSGMHDFIGTALYKHMTARNSNTVRALARLLTAPLAR
jgi:uncharacterized protein (DUF1697 family)